LCAAGCDFGCGLRLLNGSFGLGGEEGAVALRLGITLGYGGGDLSSARLGRGGANDRRCRRGRLLSMTGAMCGETLGYLLLEGKGG
jgi:hypothetical protein